MHGLAHLHPTSASLTCLLPHPKVGKVLLICMNKVQSVERLVLGRRVVGLNLVSASSPRGDIGWPL